MELLDGRPDDLTGRLPREIRTYDYLDELGITYQRTPCVCTSSLKLKTSDVIQTFLPATGHDYKQVHLVGED